MSSRDEDTKNPALFDRRVVERNIKKGIVTRKDYDKHLKALADSTGNIIPAAERRDVNDMSDDDSN